MPHRQEAMDKLRAAVEAEKREASKREQDFNALSHRMKAYQMGQAEAPTIEEFTHWRDGAEAEVRAARLKSGLAS